MADPKIPLADLPYGLPGAFDRVAGVDTATGAAKQFPMPQAGEPKDYQTRTSLPSASGLPDGTAAHVNNDPNPDNNGRWAVFGGQWVQSADRVTGLEGEVAKFSKSAGKINGWPDPFFRYFDLSSEVFLGRDRWHLGSGSSPFLGWTRVDNPVFDGYALRRSAGQGTSPLNGPAIWLDEMGVSDGDTVTVYTLVVGSGAQVATPGRFDSGVDRSYTSDQINSTTQDGGGQYVTAGATPKWTRVQATVPAGSKRIVVYPFTNTPGETFDIIALWAFKGAASDGPVWPSFTDADYQRISSSLQDSRLKSIETVTRPAVEYAVDSFDSVESDSESVEIAGSAYSTVARDLPFMGWGEIYSPAGVSFNAVRVMQVARAAAATAHWRTLTAIVRGGATPVATAAPILAIGSVRVRPDLATLDSVTIPLRDPVTGEIVTLSDASFGGNNYLLGVFARTENGDRAAMGEPRGTLPNSLGQSYYYASTQNNPEGGPWAVNAGNARIGFQHLLLTNPRVEDEFRPSTAFAAALASESAPPAPDMILPPAIFAVQGAEANVYFDNLLMQDAADYLFDVDGVSVGAHQNERWTWTPSGAQSPVNMTITVHDKRTGQVVGSGQTAVRAASVSSGVGTSPKCIFIGDSLINAGTITQTVLDDADDMGVTLLGTRGTAPNRHEGRGGWTIEMYTTNYSHETYGPNPFWIGGAVDFPGYLAANSIDVPDWVFIHLGINDVFSQSTDAGAASAAQSAFDALDILIASIKASGPAVKVALMIPTPPARDQDAFGASYGSGQTRWRFKRNILIWSRSLITRYAGQEASRVYIVPSNTALDVVNNVSRAASAPINSRTSKTAERQNNGVHPAAEGYRQIGDAVWAFLKFYASE